MLLGYKMDPKILDMLLEVAQAPTFGDIVERNHPGQDPDEALQEVLGMMDPEQTYEFGLYSGASQSARTILEEMGFEYTIDFSKADRAREDFEKSGG